ncbi:MAG: hypothetical protein JSR93_04600, partial [Verrucomicrobia bacterium]|nr:hypothetical protein [Verrucomicrobiota bacterium]
FIASTTGTLTFMISFLNADPAASPAALNERVSAISQQTVEKQPRAKSASTYLKAPEAVGIFFRGEFLYWNAELEGLDYVIRSKSISGAASPAPFDIAPTMKKGKALYPDFSWDPGFRIGIGYHIPHDQWDICLNWTRFQTDASDSSYPPSGGSIDGTWLLTSFGSSATFASAHWKLDYDVLDLELGRFYYLTRALSARPFIGLRGVWIDQHYRTTYNGISVSRGFFLPPAITNIRLKMKNDYEAFGLRAGSNLDWAFNRHWSLIGEASVSLVYGFFDVSQKSSISNPIAPFEIDSKEEFHTTKANFEVAIGLQWNTYFAKDRYHLVIAGTYEFIEWFSQNQLTRFSGSYRFPSHGNLMLQGGTFSARFEF